MSPVKSEPYYFAVCDSRGRRADYDEYSAWRDAGTAGDMALGDGWTSKGDVFHCPACPSLDEDDESDESEASA